MPDSFPAAAPATAITLATRRTVGVSLGLASGSIAAVWASEAAMGQIIASDRLAYPLLLGCFALLLALLWRRPQRLLLVQRLASLAVAAYFVASFAHQLLLQAGEPGLYTVSTLSYWLMGAHLMLFITWPPRRALLLSGLLALLVLLPAVWVTLNGPPWSQAAQWQGTLWPLLGNGFLAQVFVVATLYAVSRQLGKLALLVPATAGQASTPLTVDEVLDLRLRDLEHARDEAEQASRAKTRFLATMSHELRTPLHGVLGAAELLQQAGADAPPERRAAWLDMVQRGGTHLLHLVEDMLDLSRIEAGRLDLAQQPVDLPRCLRRALESVQPMASAKGLRLHCRLAPDLPAWVLGDGVRLTQLLINLLGNAVKFTDHGSVTLAAHPGPGGLLLQVSDTGIGIRAADQGQVFEAFTQADNGPTTRHGGTGLGLAITRQLVGLMHGSITLQSEPGRGTCFSLTLPLPTVAPPLQTAAHKAAVQALSDLPAMQAPTALAGDSLVGCRLLLVDDDPVNVAIASHLLDTLQASVCSADSGRAALQMLAAQRYDAVLMDWHMPGMDGLETTRLIRAGAAGTAALRVPVIGLTASAFDDDRAACLAAGMDDVLVKPAGAADLLRALRRQLERPPAHMPESAAAAT